MFNRYVYERLAGIQDMLIAAHKGGGALSSATKGGEREHFIDSFLSQVLPPPYRFGSGDATDQNGNKSGQLDVVVEYPFLPSLPLVGGTNRLYLAEGIAAVIEVKSDLSGQWKEVLGTAERLSALTREFGIMSVRGVEPSTRIPLYAVGYTGWKTIDTVRERLKDGAVQGILVIDSGIFVGKEERFQADQSPWSLWGLICGLHHATSSVRSTTAHPIGYFVRVHDSVSIIFRDKPPKG